MLLLRCALKLNTTQTLKILGKELKSNKVTLQKHSKTSREMFCGYAAGFFLFKVNNGNSRALCEICSKLTITTPKRRP